MSINVQNLSKVYGSQRALDSISFQAKPGEVLGFLGPNGAGKSTAMKITTCFLPQTDGVAEVCGFDTRIDPISVRKRVGYLPEHNPLYRDMFVREYLLFVSDIHKVTNPEKRVSEMVEMTGLGTEQKKRIGSLSKGYRQRVGLAQAMLHNPEVLILDEPTTGLDPNQLLEVRQLIKQLGKEKTVVFSTHIMQEVQAICDRVLIIDKGRIIADAPIAELQSKVKGSTVITIEFKEGVEKKLLEKIDSVQSVKSIGQNKWQLISPVETDVRQNVFQFAVLQKLTLLEMRKELADVEGVFQELTKN